MPTHIRTEAELDDVLTQPSAELIEFMKTLKGPLVVLGAGGKMGPTLCVLARRAAEQAGVDLEVIAVSRFSNQRHVDWLEKRSVRTVRCDLLQRDQVATLPDSPNVIYLVGRKFGTTGDPALTWAMNIFPPEYVVERYAGSRIVALSTGNVYPLVPVDSGGSHESDELIAVGEYANACVARERVFEYCSRLRSTPVCQIRLNYALDLRYGVLLDIARRVYNRQPVALSVGYVNCIWQRDANEVVLRALDLAAHPQRAINVTGAEVLSVRALAERFGELLDREVTFEGEEGRAALLSDASEMVRRFGRPSTPVDQVMKWTAEWIRNDGATLDKPTHFEQADGRY
jgi:hypothetical protein